VQILEKLYQRKSLEAGIVSSVSRQVLAEISATLEGFLPADLEHLLERAIYFSSARNAKNDPSSALQLQDFQEARKNFVPISLKGIQLSTSEVEWRDIGGKSVFFFWNAVSD
jgi:peroxin-1